MQPRNKSQMQFETYIDGHQEPNRRKNERSFLGNVSNAINVDPPTKPYIEFYRTRVEEVERTRENSRGIRNRIMLEPFDSYKSLLPDRLKHGSL